MCDSVYDKHIRSGNISANICQLVDQNNLNLHGDINPKDQELNSNRGNGSPCCKRRSSKMAGTIEYSSTEPAGDDEEPSPERISVHIPLLATPTSTQSNTFAYNYSHDTSNDDTIPKSVYILTPSGDLLMSVNNALQDKLAPKITVILQPSSSPWIHKKHIRVLT